MPSNRSVKVLLVEDEDFTRNLVADSLTHSNFQVNAVESISRAIEELDSFDPHVVVTDLDFGDGPDGSDLIERIAKNKPWIGIVILSAHSAPELAVSDKARIPKDAVYLVKSQISSANELGLAIEESISKTGNYESPKLKSSDYKTVSSTQGEILKMVADGLTNSAIATNKGISLRAAEALIQRTFQALDVKNDPNLNPRVIASRMWQQGKVIVK
jgi:DNA-binding NarL/FixJ family response regulator